MSKKSLGIVVLCVFLGFGCILKAVTNQDSGFARSAANDCRSKLRQIDSAIEQWAMDNRKNAGDRCTMQDIVPTYIKNKPVCLKSGIYQGHGCAADVFIVGDDPVCSVGNSQECEGYPHILYYSDAGVQSSDETSGTYGKDPKSAGEYLNRGISRFNKLDFDSALEDFNKAIELDPKSVHAYHYRGAAYAHKERYDLAIKDYDKAIELDPKFVTPYSDKGLAYYRAGDYGRAIEETNKALEINPGAGFVYLRRGMIYQAKGDTEQAEKDYDKAVSLDSRLKSGVEQIKRSGGLMPSLYNKEDIKDPASAQGYYVRGVSRFNKGDFSAALEDFNRAVEMDPKNAQYRFYRGAVYANTNKHDLAIKEYDGIIEIAPAFSAAYCDKGFVYYQMGDYDKAMEWTNKAIELSENNNASASHYLRRGMIHKAMAEADFDKAAELNPAMKQAVEYTRGQKGNVYEDKRKMQKENAIKEAVNAAKADLRQIEVAIEMWARDNKAKRGDKCTLNNLVPTYIKKMPVCPVEGAEYNGPACRKGEFIVGEPVNCWVPDTSKSGGLSFIWLNDLPGSEPKTSAEYYNRGFYYLRENNHDAALSDFSKAIEMDPKYVRAYFFRAKAYDQKGESEMAVKEYDKITKMDPKFARAYLMKGHYYRNLGDYSKALEEYEKTARLDPLEGDALRHIGHMCMIRGEYNKGIKKLNEWIKTNSSDALAYLFLGYSYYSEGDPEKGMQNFKKAGEIDPRYRRAAADIERSYVTIKEYTEKIKNDAKNPRLYYERGLAYRGAGDINNALKDFNRVIQMDPNDTMACFNRASIYIAKGEYDRAIQDYSKVIMSDPSFALVYLRRGSVYHYKGDYARAKKDFDMMTSIEPNLKYNVERFFGKKYSQ